jgi:vitamin K-dependent gamma-carboxylase
MTATERWLSRLNRPVSADGLALFRALFGVLMAISVLRFTGKGWIDQLYLEPDFHFSYLGFEWVKPWPKPYLYAHFALIGVSALTLGLGLFTRTSALIFFLSFTYVELLDKSAYLNHYYLVSLLAFLLIWLPSNTTFSIDARLFPRLGNPSVGAYAYFVLRVQIGLVYFYAGFAKLNPDWLLAAEPLRTWLFAHGDVPLMGALFREPATAHAMSLAGAAFDLSIVPLLLLRRTRPYAYVAAAMFHLAVWALFPIGMFSLIMLLAATVFLDPDWPSRVVGSGRRVGHARTPALGPAIACIAAIYLVAQVLLPLRFLVYPGNPNWTEEAFRFAWRVMLIEKTGSVEYRVVGPGLETHVLPQRELSALQYKMMSTQPDMIHEYATMLAERYTTPTGEPPRVYADAWASLNGRPSQRLIDPNVDLATEARTLGPASFIVPLAADADGGLTAQTR